MPRRSIVVPCAILIGVLAGCGGSAAPASSAPAAPQSPGPVSSAAPSQAAAAKPTASAATLASPESKPSGEVMHTAWVALSTAVADGLVAQDAGYFKKYGLNVDQTYVQGSAIGTAGLLSGSLDVVEMAVTASINAAVQGGDLVMFAWTINHPLYKLLAQPSVKQIGDLKGKTIAVSKFGAIDDFFVKKVLADNGVKPSDVSFVEVSVDPARFAALQAKKADAAMMSVPNEIEPLRQGFVQLSDITALNFPFQALITKRSYLQAHRAALVNYVKATAEGVRRYKQDQPYAESVIKKYLKFEDPQLIHANYDAFAKLFADTPSTTLADMQTVLDQVPVTGHKPDEFVDMSLVEELQSSGFFASLGKS